MGVERGRLSRESLLYVRYDGKCFMYSVSFIYSKSVLKRTLGSYSDPRKLVKVKQLSQGKIVMRWFQKNESPVLPESQISFLPVCCLVS